MAMTRAERAALEKAQADLQIALALRWSGHKEPWKTPVPEYFDSWINGWVICPNTCDVEEATSYGESHQTETHRRSNDVDTGCGIPLYQTKRDALIGLRLAKEREFAELLASIDDQIAAEPTP